MGNELDKSSPRRYRPFGTNRADLGIGEKEREDSKSSLVCISNFVNICKKRTVALNSTQSGL